MSKALSSPMHISLTASFLEPHKRCERCGNWVDVALYGHYRTAAIRYCTCAHKPEPVARLLRGAPFLPSRIKQAFASADPA